MNSAIFPMIPLDTATAARSVFGKSNFYLVTGDQANHLFEGLNLEDPVGTLQLTPRTLAMFYLITIFQFIENLPDPLAANALQERIDWKYALHLPMNTPGVEARSLCEFRQILLVERINQAQLQLLLRRLSEVTDFTGKQGFNLEAIQVISGVCQTSRLAETWEALKQAMVILETRYSGWLIGVGLPHWYERYTNPQRAINLGTGRLKKHSLTHMIGADGFYLLKAISETGYPGLADLPEVLKLKQTWEEQYEQIEGKVLWRQAACKSCSLHSKSPQSLINSNYNVPQ